MLLQQPPRSSWIRQISPHPYQLVNDTTPLWMSHSRLLALTCPSVRLLRAIWWEWLLSATTPRKTSLPRVVMTQPGNSGPYLMVTSSWVERVMSTGSVALNFTPKVTYLQQHLAMELSKFGTSWGLAAPRPSLSMDSQSGRLPTTTLVTSFFPAQWIIQSSFGIWTCREADSLSEVTLTQSIQFSSNQCLKCSPVVAETKLWLCGTFARANACRLSTDITTLSTPANSTFA